MSRAIVALGSNLEDPLAQLGRAIAAIAVMPGVSLLGRSSCYRTTPVGFSEQPDFINAVCEVETTLAAEQFLTALLQLEQDLGRVRTFRNAPRVIDLDLLWMEGVVRQDDFLTLPHPRMHERAFVMQPLAELCPQLLLPGRGYVADIAAALDASGVCRLGAGN